MRSFALLLLVLAPAALSAPPSPPLVVKYRLSVMKAIGGHYGALSLIAKGESDRIGDAAMHAQAIAELAKTVNGLFPPGSGPAPGVTARTPCTPPAPHVPAPNPA